MLLPIKRVALLIVLLLAPVQGLAAAIAPLMCLSSGDHHHAMHSSAGDHGQTSGHHDHEGDSSGGGHADSSSHFDCHHVFTGVTGSSLSFAGPDFPVFQTTLLSNATLHIPELPRRPPRT